MTAPGSALATGPMGSPPNLVVIVADDLGYGDISSYGGWISTPNIDSLAAQGVRFTDFYANGPVCSPTRAAFVTGQYPQRCGIVDVVSAGAMRGPEHGLLPDHPTFARMLRAAGYRTAVFGKWHLGYDVANNPVRHGFDEFRGYVGGNVDYVSHVDQAGHADWWHGETRVEEAGYVTHLVTNHAVRFIRENAARPFCLYVAHEAPHYPYQGQGDRADRTVGGVFEAYGSRPDRREAYREMVEEMDAGVGDVVRALREQGLDANTLVVFFSDNGAMTRYGSNAPLRGGKGQLWEGGIRVPAIARWPRRLPEGMVCRTPTMSLDVTAALLDMARAPLPAGYRPDGESLMAVCGDTPPQERDLFWSYRSLRAIRSGRWKLVMDGDETAGLFDLDSDPSEASDVAGSNAARVVDLRNRIDRWQRDACTAPSCHRRTILPLQQFEKARRFLSENARPLEQALFRFHLMGGTAADVRCELAAFQNADGGFGRALEIDMRTPDSSAIATTHALQIVREISLDPGHELVRSAIAYLRTIYDGANHVWPIIPSTAGNAPHAEWWTTRDLARSWNPFRANPTAELAGYLFLFGSPADDTWRQEVLSGVLDYLGARPDPMDMHELLCFVRLAEMVELPPAARERLSRGVAATVDCEPTHWSRYGLRPLTVVKSPASPYVVPLRAAVEANLDYLIDEQAGDGSWAPTWSWGNAFPDAWAVARREWQGVLTLDALKTLRAFGRLRV